MSSKPVTHPANDSFSKPIWRTPIRPWPPP